MTLKERIAQAGYDGEQQETLFETAAAMCEVLRHHLTETNGGALRTIAALQEAEDELELWADPDEGARPDDMDGTDGTDGADRTDGKEEA